MLTDGKQIAAARQLLDWSQEELAQRSGVSKPSIIRMEKELLSVKDDLRSKVIEAFSNDNVEFIDGGTRINKQIVKILEGNDCYLRLLDMAHEELKQTNGEILFSGADERRSPQQVIDKFIQMKKGGIRMRSLINEGDTHIMGSLNDYRWMNEQLFVDGDVKVIFGEYVAYLMSWTGHPRVVCIHDKNITEENRRVFDFIWNISAKPTHTTSKEMY